MKNPVVPILIDLVVLDDTTKEMLLLDSNIRRSPRSSPNSNKIIKTIDDIDVFQKD